MFICSRYLPRHDITCVLYSHLHEETSTRRNLAGKLKYLLAIISLRFHKCYTLILKYSYLNPLDLDII